MMEEDIARLEEELARACPEERGISRAIAEAEGQGQARRSGHSARQRLAELSERAGELRAAIKIGGGVADSNVIVGDKNRAVRSGTYVERVENFHIHVGASADGSRFSKSDVASLASEWNAARLVQPDEVTRTVQASVQPRPALFYDGLCRGRPLHSAPNHYFVSHGFDAETLADWRETLAEALAHASGAKEPLQPYFAGDTLLGGYRLCGICAKIYATRFSLFLLPPSQDRNVMLELGIAIGLGIPFFLIQHVAAEIPPILEGLSRYTKGGLFRRMRRELPTQIEEYDFGVVHFVADLPSAGSQPKYLIAAGGIYSDEDFEWSIKDALGDAYPHLEVISMSEQLGTGNLSAWALLDLIEAIQTSRFAIYRVDESCSPSTFLALGISIGLNRPFLMVRGANQPVPSDLQGIRPYQFKNFVRLKREIIPKHRAFFQRYA